MFDMDGKLIEVDFDIQKWKEELKKNTLRPIYWDSYNLGINRKCFPVVGLSWFEANAYCKWLCLHWADLTERQINPTITPSAIRLPSQEEWLISTGAKKESNRFPWNKSDEITKNIKDILRRANVYESGIGKTTSVCLYPLGSSYPSELWDVAGNVFEWSATLSDKSQETLFINGGSYYYDHEFALCSSRFWYPPDGRGPYLGFRVMILSKM